MKELFRLFLEADPTRLHFAAHSHHPWPDASLRGQQEAWDHAARLADQKWEFVFGKLIPEVQGHIARLLGTPDPRRIALAPNTHALVMRVLSCFPWGRPLRILTTDSEFHSFSRQAARLEEEGAASVQRVPQAPHETFTQRFEDALVANPCDLVYLSHVFYNSGFVVPDLEAIVKAAGDAVVVIDGYHAFMALALDIGPIADRVCYLGGGYKYAMSGEGVCFMHLPEGILERPRDTGWFASFGALSEGTPGVAYSPGGGRFLGATFDPSGLYRFAHVARMLASEEISPARARMHAHALQREFLNGLSSGNHPVARKELVVDIDNPQRGQFLTFETAHAKALCGALLERNVITDHRGDRLRFGFGIYQDENDVRRLLETLRTI